MLRPLPYVVPENSTTEGINRWCLTTCKRSPLECPSHTHTFVPYPATCQSPFLEMAFKWAVVTDWMALEVSHCFPCVFYSIWGEQPEVTKYIPNWVSTVVSLCPPEGSSCDDMSPLASGMAELGSSPDLAMLLASEIIPQSFDCTS